MDIDTRCTAAGPLRPRTSAQRKDQAHWLVLIAPAPVVGGGCRDAGVPQEVPHFVEVSTLTQSERGGRDPQRMRRKPIPHHSDLSQVGLHNALGHSTSSESSRFECYVGLPLTPRLLRSVGLQIVGSPRAALQRRGVRLDIWGRSGASPCAPAVIHKSTLLLAMTTLRIDITPGSGVTADCLHANEQALIALRLCAPHRQVVLHPLAHERRGGNEPRLATLAQHLQVRHTRALTIKISHAKGDDLRAAQTAQQHDGQDRTVSHGLARP